MTLFRNIVSLDEALRIWSERLSGILKPISEECIDVLHSAGRITSRPVWAENSSPWFHASAMDGYAVRFLKTTGASERNPVLLKIPDDAVRVDTGDPLLEGYDAVVMIEDVNIIEKDEDRFIELREPITPWQNVRIIGEDIIKGELIIPENYEIKAFEVGAMLGSGIKDVWVKRRPVMGIIPTGSEMVEPWMELKHGNLIEFNSRFIQVLLTEMNTEVIRHDIVPDDISLLKEAIIDYSERCDVIMTIGGSSLGREDLLSRIIEEIGEVIVHGVNIKPGKPVLLGIVNKKPFIGIPGYPVSAYITFELFIRPIIFKIFGIPEKKREKIHAVLSRSISSPLGQEEFVRVKIGRISEKYIATPITRGAGLMMSLVRADGILRIPERMEGISAQSIVEVELLKDKDELNNTIVCIGSHDNILDLLANRLRHRYPQYSLSSAHVGSTGCLLAIKRREAHLGGVHLLDEVTGEYNVPFIKKIIPDIPVYLINLVYRTQGLIVKKGNPKNIRNFEDLVRNDVVFVNRQKGSGTRLLLDKNLRELNIDPSRIRGYENEDITHMSVASKISTGVADVGLGIFSSAKAFDLDFIPITEERYDLVIPLEFIDTPMIAALLDIIRNDMEFKKMVIELGGYDVRDMGKIIYTSGE